MGEEMAMDNESKTLNLEQPAKGDADASPKVPTVGAMSPEYPKHRDALILIVSILILIVIVVGGYFLVRGKSISLPKIAQEPFEFFRSLLRGGETYDVCSNFIRTHQDLFKELGGDLEWSVVTQEIRVVNNDKRARLIFKVKGNKIERLVYFLLRKYGDTWRINSVDMKTGPGKFERLYPGKRSSNI